jgi:hypothetical protein
VPAAPAGQRVAVPAHPVVVDEGGDVGDGDDDVVVGEGVDGRVRTRARAREDQRADRILPVRPCGELRENLGFVGQPEHALVAAELGRALLRECLDALAEVVRLTE